MTGSISGTARTITELQTPSTPTEKVGDFDTELVKEFMIALSSNSRMTLHFKMFHGENGHHIIEAMFKGLGRALGEAVSIDEKYRDEIPSTKGVL